jgi:PAS domain S-box-containing protein
MSDNVRVLPRTNPETTASAVLAAVRAGGHLVFDWNIATDRCSWFDPPEGKVLGHAASALANRDALLALVHPDDLLSVRLATEALQRDPGKPVAVQLRIRAVDGQWRWVESRGCLLPPGRFAGSLLDINERKRTESQLAISALLLETIYDAVIVTGADGAIRWANSAAANLLGVPLATLAGRSLAEYSADSRERQLELHQEIRDTVTRSGVWRGRVGNIAANGAPITLDAAVCRVNGDDGELWIHVRRDLRERMQLRQAEQAEARSEQQRLGRQLNESLSQELTAASLLLRGLGRQLPADTSEPVMEIERILRDSISRCRQLAQGISPFVLGEHGFAIAMQSLGKWAEQQGADKVSVAVTRVAGTIDGDAAHLVHRVAQDVVTEVCAAETGASIDIRVWQEGAHICASIADDVVRADDASTEQKELMLAYRAESLGATLDTVMLANGGRRIILQIPDRSALADARRFAASA